MCMYTACPVPAKLSSLSPTHRQAKVDEKPVMKNLHEMEQGLTPAFFGGDGGGGRKRHVNSGSGKSATRTQHACLSVTNAKVDGKG